MLTLKKYQKTTLENLRLFLEEARFGKQEEAFEKYRTESAKRAAPLAPYPPLFDGMRKFISSIETEMDKAQRMLDTIKL